MPRRPGAGARGPAPARKSRHAFQTLLSTLALLIGLAAAGGVAPSPAVAAAAARRPSAEGYLWEFQHGVGFSPEGCHLLPLAYVSPCVARAVAATRGRYLYYWNHGANFTAAQCHELPQTLLPSCLMAVLVQLTYPPVHPESAAERTAELRAFARGARLDLASCARLPAAYVAACVARAPDLKAASLQCQGVSGTTCQLAGRAADQRARVA